MTRPKNHEGPSAEAEHTKEPWLLRITPATRGLQNKETLLSGYPTLPFEYRAAQIDFARAVAFE